MNELTKSAHANVDRLEAITSQMPQVDVGTRHVCDGGVYVRTVRLSKDTLATGKTHKHPHWVVLLRGRVLVTDTVTGVEEVHAPRLMEAPAGSRRVVLALTDCLWVNLHETPETDLDALEAALIAPMPAAGRALEAD